MADVEAENVRRCRAARPLRFSPGMVTHVESSLARLAQEDAHRRVKGTPEVCPSLFDFARVA
jgi:hypothetical protein